MPTREFGFLQMIQHRKKGKGFARKLEEKISLQVTDGYGRLGFSFSYGTLLLIKERLQKYYSQAAHHSDLYEGIYERCLMKWKPRNRVEK